MQSAHIRPLRAVTYFLVLDESAPVSLLKSLSSCLRLQLVAYQVGFYLVHIVQVLRMFSPSRPLLSLSLFLLLVADALRIIRGPSPSAVSPSRL